VRRRARFGLADEAFFGGIEAFKQRLLRPGEALTLGKINETLQRPSGK